MNFDLTTLGWKSFQDLCCAVAAEVLQRPVQSFLGSSDGGRDAAFMGRWDGTKGAAKSTIQCKFMSKPGANLTLSSLKGELAKAKKLAASGLAEDYIVLTNAGVSGEADKAICIAFKAVGVAQCRVFGGSWIVEQLKERPRLRTLAPRVYGIGDLTQIIASNAYNQASAILKSMGEDLGCFVSTAAYRDAVAALQRYGFVILLGDPASGKSTIAALLTLASLDEGHGGALRIAAPDQLHLWHPDEKQVLFVDDAFGSNQFDVARMARWNAELGTLRAAVENGARVVFTSRNYIWAAARPQLKIADFPLLSESQIVVNVQELTDAERAQMLYNHVRHKQPLAMRRKLKPFLAGVAANEKFLPETARRLGDPLFTCKLLLTEERIRELVEHPIEFLQEVLEQLDDASKAAIALIFLHPASGVPSPVPQSEILDTVTRLYGVASAAIGRALEHLDDSLTRLVPAEDGPRWIYRHPTVTDAFASIVARSPELVEIYVRGARVERLMREVVCKPAAVKGASVRVPSTLYPALQDRIVGHELDESLKAFLGERCDAAFLTGFTAIRPDILEWASTVSMENASAATRLLVGAVNSAGLLSEERREEIVESISYHSITWLETEVFEDEAMKGLFTNEEFANFATRFHAQWLTDLSNTFWELAGISSSDELSLYVGFRENLERAERFYRTPEDGLAWHQLFERIDEHISELEDAQPPDSSSAWTAPKPAVTPTDLASIFDDIDVA